MSEPRMPGKVGLCWACGFSERLFGERLRGDKIFGPRQGATIPTEVIGLSGDKRYLPGLSGE